MEDNESNLLKPNIILLTIDALRADMLGCYGNIHSKTPSIDSLAKCGIRFERAITAGTWTQAAFPALFTSTYPSMYGGCLDSLSRERPSLVESLASFGYLTAGFSTNPHLGRRNYYDRGFKDFFEFIPKDKDLAIRRVKGGQYLLRKPQVHKVLQVLNIRVPPPEVYTPADEVTDQLCQWMEQVDRPFFVWVHYMDVHWPYHKQEFLLNSNEVALAWQDMSAMYDLLLKKKAFSDNRAKRLVNLYQKALEYLDSQIARLLIHIRQLNLDKSTVIAIVADHGEEFLDHGRWSHQESNLYDETIRVPLIIRMPGLEGGKEIKHQVRTLDLMPTLLDLCGCPLPANIEGISLAPLWLNNENQYNINEAITEMHRPPWHRIAVRSSEFKFIWDNQKPDLPELYDLLSDPAEKENVSKQYPLKIKYFQARVQEHLDRITRNQPAEPNPGVKLDRDLIKRMRDLGYMN